MGPAAAESRGEGRPRVAIVGAGASGVAAAWMLAQSADVTLFERDARVGGHAHTERIEHRGSTLDVDLGAQFFERNSYPTFTRLLLQLGVATRATKQTFTVLEDEGRSYFSAGAALRNLVGPGAALRRQWLAELLWLTTVAPLWLRALPWSFTLRELVRELPLSPSFVERVLYPMVGASFGTCREQSEQMSAKSALYYVTAGLRPVALTRQTYQQVVGGCGAWVAAALRDTPELALRVCSAVTALERTGVEWRVVSDTSAAERFNHVVLALPPSAAARLLQALPEHQTLSARLAAVRSVHAELVIHGDRSVLPRDRRAWSGFMVHHAHWAPGATVWLGEGTHGAQLFKTWAANVPVRGAVHASASYTHPVMDGAYYAAQAAALNHDTRDGLHFAGSFATSVDNHESAVLSALRVARRIAPDARRVHALDGRLALNERPAHSRAQNGSRPPSWAIQPLPKALVFK